ncbi:hypothetical protein [Janthinobacterium sp. PSPC3-1]|uniref:hypothetical protein n=1 Tax=Janthinobacterium sp. PSPC3-1 TaxID=2804653 RepID=UPI003CF3BEDC
MASKFTAGMKNVVEVLNQMWDAFAAGPFNALPLTGGALTGPLTSTSTITVTRTGTAGIIEQLALLTNSGGAGISGTAIRFGYPGTNGYGSRIVGAGDPTGSSAGYTAFETGTGGGASGYPEVARITETGAVLIGAKTLENSGQLDLLQVHGPMRISSPVSSGAFIMAAGYRNSPSFLLYGGDGGTFNQPSAVMYLTKAEVTARSISANGTVNTGGNDYAEYIPKSACCAAVAKGQIVGITAENTIADQWSPAVMFAIKSTAPSFVGGDTWSSGLGPRPQPQAGSVPTPPARRDDVIEQQPLPGTEPQEYLDVVTPGDTDAEWSEKQTAYAAALAAHAAAAQHDAEAMATFEAALEVERQKVDRIAIAGRVPVNVMGARPGDYIVPVQDGEGIAGIAVHADDITMAQYRRAVGRVISIEPDGRAYVMVKAV